MSRDETTTNTKDATMTTTNGNYTATIVMHANGDYRVTVLYLNGTHQFGDVCFAKTYDRKTIALRAAKRELAKAAG